MTRGLESSWRLALVLACAVGCQQERSRQAVDEPTAHGEASEVQAESEAAEEPIVHSDVDRTQPSTGCASELLSMPDVVAKTVSWERHDLFWPPVDTAEEGVVPPPGEVVLARRDFPAEDGTRRASLIVTASERALRYDSFAEYFERMAGDQLAVYIDEVGSEERLLLETIGPVELEWGGRAEAGVFAAQAFSLRSAGDRLIELCAPTGWSRAGETGAGDWDGRCFTWVYTDGGVFIELDAWIENTTYRGVAASLGRAVARASLVDEGESGQAIGVFPGGDGVSGDWAFRLPLSDAGVPAPSRWQDEWVTCWLQREGDELEASSSVQALAFLRRWAAGLRSDSERFFDAEARLLRGSLYGGDTDWTTGERLAELSEVLRLLADSGGGVLPVPTLEQLLGSEGPEVLPRRDWAGAGYELEAGGLPWWSENGRELHLPGASGLWTCDARRCARTFANERGSVLLSSDGRSQIVGLDRSNGSTDLVLTSARRRSVCDADDYEAGVCRDTSWAELRWPQLESGRVAHRVRVPSLSGDSVAPLEVIGWMAADAVLLARGREYFRLSVPAGELRQVPADDVADDLHSAAGLSADRSTRWSLVSIPGTRILWEHPVDGSQPSRPRMLEGTVDAGSSGLAARGVVVLSPSGERAVVVVDDVVAGVWRMGQRGAGAERR